MGFGTGFAEGLATSVNRMLQLDIQRNMDRMSRAENYLYNRYEATQEAERAKLKKRTEVNNKMLEEYAELKQLLGNDTRAMSAIDAKGGTYNSLSTVLADMREQSERGIDLNKYFTVAESQNPQGQFTADDAFLINRYGYLIEREAAPGLPEQMRGTTGLLKQMGVTSLGDDIPEYESVISDDLTARVKDDVVIPKGTINYDAGYKAMTFAKEMDDKYTSFEEGETRLQQKIEAATTSDEKTKYENELINLINLHTKVKHLTARTNGTKVESVFKDPIKAQNLIDKAYNRATKNFSEVDLETGISRALEGTEAQTFEALFNAQDNVRATYTSGEGEDAFIDPLLDRLLRAEKERVQGQVNGYIAGKVFDFMEKKREMSGATDAQVLQTMDKYTVEPDAATVNDKMIKGIYKPGTVIRYEDANGNIKVVVWTGTKPLPGTFDF